MTIDQYIANQPPQTQIRLRELRKIILEAAPDSTELFNYNIPAFALTDGGKRDQQIMIAGYKSHVGFYPHPSTISRFETELEGYKMGKGSVQFPVKNPLPRTLILRMVTYRLDEVSKPLQ